jgi:hypothetical protein
MLTLMIDHRREDDDVSANDKEVNKDYNEEI